MKRYVKVFSQKAGKYIRVDVCPKTPENERVKRVIGLSNALATG